MLRTTPECNLWSYQINHIYKIINLRNLLIMNFLRIINSNFNRIRVVFLYPSVFLCLLMLIQCQEPVKGCLDARATNFDVTAAKTCEEDCCLYPNLKIQFDYAFDTLNFNFNTPYKFGTDSIRFISAQFYVSNVQLIKDDGSKASVIDSILLFRDKDSIRVPNYYALVGKNNGFETLLGKFNQVGVYSKIGFKMGLELEASKTIPSKMPSSSPLSIKSDSMYISSEKAYIFNKMTLYRTTPSKMTDTFRLVIKTLRSLELKGNRTLVLKDGFDAIVPLKIDYKKWLEGVNFSSPINSIQDKIVSNTEKAFIFNQ
jgi:hypothetical protein